MISETTLLSILTMFLLMEAVHLIFHYATVHRFFKSRLFEKKETGRPVHIFDKEA